MALAVRSLSQSRREWALAMRTEFNVAVADGRPFAFATGCLIAVWGEMPKHADGRQALANYALALGLLIPVAAFQFALALGFSSAFAGAEAFDGVLVPGASNHPMLAWSQLSAVPCLLALWLFLGLGHLRLAWVLIEGDWTGVANVSAFMAAVLVTLFILMATLVLDVTFVILQAGVMAVEVTALVASARRHARVLAHSHPAITEF